MASWNPTTTSSSSPQHLYSIPAFRNVEFAHNAYASPSFLPSHQHMSSDSLSVQVPSSIGPNRTNSRSTGIITRRKAAQIAALQNVHQRDNSNNIQNSIPSFNHQQRQHSLAFMHSSGSRPHTPNDYSLSNTNYQPQAELPPLSLPPNNDPATMQPTGASPQYPPTPASTSPYSPYNFFQTHSRSNSNSNSNPRSASPALSIASALTSVSSSTANSVVHPPTPGNMSPVVRKHKKQRLFNVDRKDICLYHKENPNARQEDIAMKYGVERSTISKILKHKQKWMNVPEDEELKVAKHRPSKFPEIESQLVEWLTSFTASNNSTLSDSLIRSKAKEVAKNLRISEEKFKASSGWVENFKHRHGIRRGVWYGEGKTMKPPPSGSSTLPPSADQGGGLLPSFNSGFLSNAGVGNLLNDRNLSTSSALASGNPSTIRDMLVDEDPYRTQQPNRPIMSLRPPWSSSDRSPVVESVSAGSSSSKATSDHSFSHPDTPASAVSLHGPSMTLRSAWDPQQLQAPTLDRPPAYETHQNHDSTSPDASSGSSNHNNVPAPQTPLPSLHPYHTAPSPSPSQNVQNAPYPGLAVYSNMPPIYRPTINAVPDIIEAEDAVDKVIRYVDAQPHGYITEDEREALAQIKYTLFQTAGGQYQSRDKR